MAEHVSTAVRYRLAYTCEICENAVTIDYPEQAREICPECAKKLRVLIKDIKVDDNG